MSVRDTVGQSTNWYDTDSNSGFVPIEAKSWIFDSRFDWPGEWLFRGQSLESDSVHDRITNKHGWTLAMQPDGNLVLFHGTNTDKSNIKWASLTNDIGVGPYTCRLGGE